jgi:hypothetical protein
MIFETTADRRLFVKDFGESVTFRGSSIGFKQVTAIFDNEYAGMMLQGLRLAIL